MTEKYFERPAFVQVSSDTCERLRTDPTMCGISVGCRVTIQPHTLRFNDRDRSGKPVFILPSVTLPPGKTPTVNPEWLQARFEAALWSTETGGLHWAAIDREDLRKLTEVLK